MPEPIPFPHAYIFIETDDLTQEDYRVFNDDVSLNAATAIAALNTPVSWALGSKLRLRISIQETSGESSSYRYILEFRVNGGDWGAVDSSTDTGVQATSSTFFTDAAATTQRLDTTTFVAGEGIETLRASALITLTSSGSPVQTELEWNLLLLGVSFNVGDTIEFRVVATSSTWSGGGYTASVLNGYTNTPTFTVASATSGGSTMSERASVFEAVQIGVETVPGTAVAATKRLLGVTMDLDVVAAITTFRPMGFKSVTAEIQGKEYAQGTINGIIAYADAVYLASSAFVKATPTTPANNATWVLAKGSSTFTLTFNSVTTASIASDATAAAVQAALEAISTIGVGNVTVTGTNPNFVVQFVGWLSTTTLTLSVTGTGATCTLQAAGSAVRRWTFLPAFNSPDTLQTFTIERGIIAAATTLAQQAAYASLTGLSFSFDKNNASLSGALFARKVNDTFQPTTSGVTDVTMVPVDPKSVSLFMGTALVGTGAPQRLTRALSAAINFTGRQSPIITLDDSQTSFSAVVENAPDLTFSMTLEHDAIGQAALTSLRAGTMQFIVVEAISGVNVETGFPYRFKVTMPVLFKDPSFTDVDGVRCIVLNGDIAYSSLLAGFFKMEVDCAVTAL